MVLMASDFLCDKFPPLSFFFNLRKLTMTYTFFHLFFIFDRGNK